LPSLRGPAKKISHGCIFTVYECLRLWHTEYMTNYAFWLSPDWSGGTNLRDPGNQPFWMLDPLPYEPDLLPVPKAQEPEPKLLGLEWRNWKPRRSLLCRMGFHKFLSYTLEPWEFKCHRCGCLKDLRSDPAQAEPVKCTHFSCNHPIIERTGETSGYCSKHKGKPYCRGEYCFNKRDDSTSLWCKKCDPDPPRKMDRPEQHFGVSPWAPCTNERCMKTRTFGSLLCKQHLADKFDEIYMDKNPSAKPCAVAGCKRPARPIRNWVTYCIGHAPKDPKNFSA
jgi:hypothetical protein